MNNGILLADLTRCEPRDAISRDGRDGTWIAVDYVLGEGAGTMLMSTPESGAPDLTLTLVANGWHEIRLGIYYGGGAGTPGDRFLCAKLTGDAAFSRFGREVHNRKDGTYPEKQIGGFDIAEVFWRCADLAGQDLVFARPPRGKVAEYESCLAYVRLVPMDETAVAAWHREQPTAGTSVLIGNYDGGNISQWGVSTEQDVLAEFECMRDSDFDIALYAVAACCRVGYPSKVADYHDNEWARRRRENGVDLLAEAIGAAHECGVKLFPQNRLCGLNLPPRSHRDVHRGEFIAEHPQWLCRFHDDEPTRHLSLAYPGVRDFYVRMFREWVEDYRADGVNVLFSRSFPFAYYEQPVRKAFEAEYGEDMRKVPQDDRRTWKARATFVTQFLREIRAMLDEVGRAQGRELANCYLVPHGNAQPGFPYETAKAPLDEPLHAALDCETWIREGLVDYLVLHMHFYMEHDGSPYREVIEEYARLAKGTKTKIIADIYPRRLPPRVYRKIAMTYYDAGADGLAFWDSYGRYYRSSEWAFVKRLGHRDDLPRWEGKGDDYFRVLPLERLDEFVTGRLLSGPTDG